MIKNNLSSGFSQKNEKFLFFFKIAIFNIKVYNNIDNLTRLKEKNYANC